jgi:hypothetical protein
MAVSYKPHKSGKTLLIGGQSVTTATDGGLVGPFPRFSVNREELSTGDGTYLGTKFSIEITGTATLNPDDTQDITVKGQRQSRVQGEGLTALQFDRDIFPTQGTGILEISPYGGQPNTIKFGDARLLSVSLPEQSDEEAGVQNLQYTFSFEAYTDESSNTNSGTSGSPQSPEYKLSSAEENWELSENEGVAFFKDNDPESTLHKVYTLTHTISATGIKKYASQGTLDTDGEAWRQAQLWVETRLRTSDDIKDPVTDDLLGDSAFWLSQFVPINMSKNGALASVVPDLKSGTPPYKGYNHTRSVSSDISSGSYSVTETWLVCAANLTATHDIEVNIEDDKGAFVSVSVAATFQGLDSGNPTVTEINKFSNAQTSYSAMQSNFYNLANSAYSGAGYSDGLRNEKITESIGQNRVAGTITYNVSFNDNQVSLSGAISDDININYDNVEGLNEVIAKIPIIGKDDGPIIQDMSTTTIKTISATLDAVMNRDNRVNRPFSAATLALESYKPDGGKQQTKTESWNPKTGAYNLSISWEYN